jgi:hypothetical protein
MAMQLYSIAAAIQYMWSRKCSSYSKGDVRKRMPTAEKRLRAQDAAHLGTLRRVPQTAHMMTKSSSMKLYHMMYNLLCKPPHGYLNLLHNMQQSEAALIAPHGLVPPRHRRGPPQQLPTTPCRIMQLATQDALCLH